MKKTYESLFSMVIFCLFALIVVFLVYPDNSAAREPWGIYVERVEDSEGLERCRVCGRIIGIGSMHMDAEVIIENHLKDKLSDMDIEYIDHKGTGKYIHVLIYKFIERKGGNLAVEKPASIGFHIHLIDKNNTLRRVYVFEETQQALSQNVLNIRKFLRRRAKWLTASELAEEGIYAGLETLKGDMK
ncbi:MAG TPA: hypothetical protein PKW07_09130 [Syntrophorhabdaceae bacterium]|nr:hypothetical protein [Syntrophorhabdaceae bacterium]